METGSFIEHPPTMGKDKKELDISGTKITLFDMGGQTHFRKLWIGEIAKDTGCVVFVIDRSDPSRFEEAKAELQKLAPVLKKEGVKLLIFANKSDLSKSVPIDVIYETFSLNELDSFEIIPISAKTGFGMADAFIRLYSTLTGKIIKRQSVASAISIYSTGGIPLVTKYVNENDAADSCCEGGFLSAITSFAGLKMGNNTVKIEGEDKNTFIIHRSTHFIGGLLWNTSLNIPIEESESALKELLIQLENTANCEDVDDVSFHVTQYCTNLL